MSEFILVAAFSLYILIAGVLVLLNIIHKKHFQTIFSIGLIVYGLVGFHYDYLNLLHKSMVFYGALCIGLWIYESMSKKK